MTTKFQYDDFDDEVETSLHDACYFYGDPEVVAEAHNLEADGFGSARVTIIYGDWRDGMYAQHRKAMVILGKNIKEMILRKELIAFGSHGNPFDGPKWLKPAKWKHAKVSLSNCKMKIGDSTITNIVLFRAKNPREAPVDRSAKTINRAELEKTYRAYVANLLKAGSQSNREDDVKAMKALFDGRPTNDAIKVLRRQFAPKEWQEPGRRKSG